MLHVSPGSIADSARICQNLQRTWARRIENQQPTTFDGRRDLMHRRAAQKLCGSWADSTYSHPLAANAIVIRAGGAAPEQRHPSRDDGDTQGEDAGPEGTKAEGRGREAAGFLF